MFASVRVWRGVAETKIETDQPQQNKALHPTAYSLRSFARASLRRSGFRRRVSLVVLLRRAALLYVIMLSMKSFRYLFCIGLCLFLASVAQAYPSYKSKTEMIETAEVIAIVEITKVEKVLVHGKEWTYEQKATAKVERVLVGTLSEDVFLYGDEIFECSHCHFEVGRYLVFLDRDGELWTANNWGYSACKVTEDMVKWLYPGRISDGVVFERRDTPLAEVLKEIDQVLAKAKQSKS